MLPRDGDVIGVPLQCTLIPLHVLTVLLIANDIMIMQHLYDPLDPDKDTLAQHRLTRNEELDHEFWLLRQLGRVLEKANFQRLPHHMICEEMREHDTNEGVRVSVNVNSYDTLQVCPWSICIISSSLK